MTVKIVSTNTGATKSSMLHQVAYVARVSNPSNQYNNESAEKLVEYLIKHNHWSPFEMISICMEIETTRDIARQILRHRSFSFQEFSQRYADPTDSLGFTTREARLQDKNNRQNSYKIDKGSPTERGLNEQWNMRQMELIRKVKDLYSWALNNGIAKEQARAILPEGLTRSRMYMNGTLRSWIHYIELRSRPGTQLEHRLIAIDCANALKEDFPMIEKFVDRTGL